MSDYVKIGRSADWVYARDRNNRPLMQSGSVLYIHTPTGVVVADIEAHTAALDEARDKQ